MIEFFSRERVFYVLKFTHTVISSKGKKKFSLVLLGAIVKSLT